MSITSPGGKEKPHPGGSREVKNADAGPRWLQTEWPSRRVFVTSLTEELSTVAIVGPKSRDVLKELAPGIDLSKVSSRFSL